MLIQGYHKGRTQKEVTFLDAANDDSDSLVDAALTRAGETMAGCFGTQVRRYPDGGAIVTIFTD